MVADKDSVSAFIKYKLECIVFTAVVMKKTQDGVLRLGDVKKVLE